MKNSYDEANLHPAIVLDSGSSILRAGLAGEEFPSLEFPSIIGKPKYPLVMLSEFSENDLFLGNNAISHKGILTMRHPINRGLIQNWSDMEIIWQHMYTELKYTSDEHKILIAERPLGSKKIKEKTAEIFFENFNVPAIYFADEAILTLYSSGKTTGVVLASGDGISYASPIFDGFSIFHAITRSEIGGCDITKYLSFLLRKAGYIFHTSSELQAVKDIKEKDCYIPFRSISDELKKKGSEVSQTSHPVILPDGTEISLGIERYYAPEILFQPSLIGLEYPGIPELLTTSISRCDLDIRKSLYSGILLAGGTTLFQGFGERLINETRKLAPKNITIRIHSPPERQHSVWMGGSVLASLSAFKPLWISKQEYNTEGSAVALRRVRW